jgi:hypothetical protein
MAKEDTSATVAFAMPSSKEDRTYTPEEVEVILSRAAKTQPSATALSHEELLDTAAQVGISREAVELAAKDLVRTRIATEEDHAVVTELEIQRQRARRGLLAHLVVYASVNALLVTINVLTGSFPWAVFPALGWGVALALHLFVVASPNPRRAQRARDKVRQREEKRKKRERERRREAAGPLGESAKELGVALERGVATMFSAAAKRIHEEVARVEGTLPEEAGVRVDAGGSGSSPIERKARVADEDEADEDERIERGDKERRR